MSDRQYTSHNYFWLNLKPKYIFAFGFSFIFVLTFVSIVLEIFYYFGPCVFKVITNDHSLNSVTDEALCLITFFWCCFLLSLSDYFRMETPLAEGDTVNVECQDAEEWAVDGTQGLLVLHPDCLMSGTSVVAGVFCRRKAVLNELFKGYDPPNKHMVIGSLLHQVFQKVNFAISFISGHKKLVACNIFST